VVCIAASSLELGAIGNAAPMNTDVVFRTHQEVGFRTLNAVAELTHLSRRTSLGCTVLWHARSRRHLGTERCPLFVARVRVARKIQNAERGRGNIARRTHPAHFCNTIPGKADMTRTWRSLPSLTPKRTSQRIIAGNLTGCLLWSSSDHDFDAARLTGRPNIF
jgi:hypothetical protein